MDRSRERLLFRGAPDLPVEKAQSRRVAILTAYCDIARERVALRADELRRELAVRIGLDLAEPDSARMYAEVESDLFDDPAAPVTMLVPDVVVFAPALTDGIVLTHRLSAAELADEHLDLDTDLAGFLRCPDPHVVAGPIHVDESDGDHAVQWGGPEGWLAEWPAGTLLAVRATADGAVTISALAAEPAVPVELVSALRAVYEAELAEPGLPVSAEILVLGLLHRDRAAFAEPRPPLIELAAEAGLLLRGDEFAHDESVWAEAEAADRDLRLILGLSPEHGEAAMAAFALLAGDRRDPAALREALALLADPDVLESVVTELLYAPDGEEEPVARLVALAERLLAAAGRSPREAVARWVAAVAAERDGRVADAESHLRAAALAAEGWPLVEDRLAWYESDGGDAGAAAARWRAIEVPADDPDLVAVLPFASAAGPEPGRNDPCWCGSGRKYKQCHIGRPELPPLPVRAEWLYRKAATYVERRGGAASDALAWWADVLDAEIDDPAVVDAALVEGGWFARFLAERGPLLPADEAELAASWAAVRHGVYEVEGVRFGEGATLRDLRSGARVDVRVPDGESPGMGELVLARVLPDGSGAGHVLAGAVFGVQRGTEYELLGMLHPH